MRNQFHLEEEYFFQSLELAERKVSNVWKIPSSPTVRVVAGVVFRYDERDD
jgi:hypothetical protein